MTAFALWLRDLWHSFWLDWHQQTLRASYRNHGVLCEHAMQRYTHHALALAELRPL